MNTKVLKKLNVNMTKQEIEDIIAAKPECIETFLIKMKPKVSYKAGLTLQIERYLERKARGVASGSPSQAQS